VGWGKRVKVFIDPTYRTPDAGDGGIRRVVEAQQRYLPQYGWGIAQSPDEADLIVNHGAALTERPGVPMVAVCHGLMWESYGFGQWGDSVNKAVIETMARAQAVTAPSQWVAHAVSRGMLLMPEVVYHGVDLDDWTHDHPLGYVLWNKARVDAVSDPQDMNDVAALLPDVPFLSTFGTVAPNVHLLGAVPYEQMRTVVQRASVYLATARETFGIGTLEALSAGVPVAGWKYGGQEEIIIQGETGYLATWGDEDELAWCIRQCLEQRDRLSRNAREDAGRRWRWEDKILHYATLFDRVVAEHRQERPKVSVVVTTYNLSRYLGAALDSIKAQTLADYECIVVDDQSNEGNDEPDSTFVRHVSGDRRFRLIRTPSNLKLSGARNYGWQHATGQYVLFLDADDMLSPNALDLLGTALDRRTDLSVAFGHLDTVDDQGRNQQRNPWPGAGFDWHGQIAHLNQLPYAAMMRREVLERSGGYRTRDWRAEDASFWSRVSSFGFRIAKVTEDATLLYRLRSDSKSRGEDSDGDWTAWLPWRTAGNPMDGMEAQRTKRQPNPYVVPFGAQGKPPAPRKAWPVWHHQEPLVSIVIPVGPGHARYLTDALDSVQAQTFPFWEAIVVNDTGGPLDTAAHPWARVWDVSRIEGDTAVRMGAGSARNWGLRHARAPLVTFLDADDLLVPRALEAMVSAYVLNDGRYVYGDWLHLEDEGRWDGPAVLHTVPEYDPELWLQGAQHAVTCLVETEQARAVGGFDEQLPAWEDWDFLIKLAVHGVCGVRVAEPTLIYRLESGQRRKVGDTKEAELLAAIRDRYAAYTTGATKMAGCCGGKATTQAQAAIDMLYGVFDTGDAPEPVPAHGPVRMEFVGDEWGALTYRSEDQQRTYRAGRDPIDRYIDVAPDDVVYLERLGKFRRVQLPPEPVYDPQEELYEVPSPVESVTRRQRRAQR
jgi:glycosyltransferase involved in cell wall biosynthesis